MQRLCFCLRSAWLMFYSYVYVSLLFAYVYAYHMLLLPMRCLCTSVFPARPGSVCVSLSVVSVSRVSVVLPANPESMEEVISSLFGRNTEHCLYLIAIESFSCQLGDSSYVCTQLVILNIDRKGPWFWTSHSSCI
jgi:hypothetical protein